MCLLPIPTSALEAFLISSPILLLLLSHVRFFATHRLQHVRLPLVFTISWSLLKFITIELVMLSNHLNLCHPLLLPSIFPNIKSFPMSPLFSSGSQSIGASNSASVLPLNIQGLISFRIYWFDLLAVQGTLKSNIQHHSSKA